MKIQKPIGVFDSGVGGLSVCHAIRRALPSEDLMYVADIEFSPYGNKSRELLQERAEYIVSFLVSQGCKAIVVACNTATVNSVSSLRSKYSLPFIGVEPGIKPAASMSKTGVIGVLATEQTLKSDSFKALKRRHSDNVRVETIACPEFVSLVESLKHNTEQAVEVAGQYIQPLLSEGCDQIILGCTHFSFLRKTIEMIVQGKANIIDTATPVASELNRRLQALDNLNKPELIGRTDFWTCGEPEKVERAMSALWGEQISVSKLVQHVNVECERLHAFQ